jgi:hypothetical protein
MHKLAKMIIRILAEEKFYFLWEAISKAFWKKLHTWALSCQLYTHPAMHRGITSSASGGTSLAQASVGQSVIP